ncbi:MAG: hypothetical protein KF739_01030 [Cryobacterium sp.]|nr:hypothetical protein [Micrococcales bacterium]MBX3309001.1 hypothetical protein [Cryobacterium sp.]
MTMTLDRPRSAVTEATPTVRWHAHQAGVWVAYEADRFVGMVEEFSRNGFTATTRLGKHLGHFPTLDQAKAALERSAIED